MKKYGMLLSVCLTLLFAAGCGNSQAAESVVIDINVHSESITKATIHGSTLILDRKLEVPAWAEESGISIDNMPLWTHLDRVAVEIDPVVCLVDHAVITIPNCFKFDAVGTYVPMKGLKSIDINRMVIRVSNQRLYDQWIRAIKQAKEKSLLPEIEN